MSTNKPIGVGIIGASPGYTWATLAHLPALATLPAFRVVAVSTTRTESANETAKKFCVPRAFGRPEPLIEDPEVELVVVSVRAPSHAPLVRAALAARKHVFCEWPVGATSADTGEFAVLAREAGVRTVAGLQRRLAPGVRHVKKLIDEGYLGQLRSVNVIGSVPLLGARRPASWAYTADLQNGANALHTMTAHFLDTALSVVGEPASFQALVARQFSEATLEETGEKIPVTAPDQIEVAGTLRSGAVFSVRIESGKRNGANIAWTFTGTEGDLALGPDLALVGARGDGQPLTPIEVPADPAWPARGELSDDAFQTAHLYAGFAAESPLVPTFDDAARFRRMLEAFVESSTTGRRIEWPER
ncbi:Gfo/Idh/MocA family protein [Corallococcus silvisoli]|uniref:Gfo/Idh/MocA family protein n=1 Tax=Corallococcus silvisoli TaxID=2697031 RepID=UPI001378A098|nr:Gfo/Idh/MocA family oxidoreductase [Corallococcus silvisoli]NBD12361.1 Gfo/Idh/MocA family oxidoreductase [Corallococcus silvisoli]